MIDALITGKLIKDPQLKTGQQSGKPFTNFLLSVPVGDAEPVIVSGIAFGDVAERIAKLQKGDALSITGSLSPSSWTDKTTGELKHGLNITVSATLSPSDVKKRRGNAEGNGTAPQSRQDAPNSYGGYPEFNDAIGF